MTLPNPVLAARYRALALASLARRGCPLETLPTRVGVVDPFRQQFGLLVDGTLEMDTAISTAADGLGCVADSHQTPTGWHRIAERLGEGTPRGTIFRGRRDTGEIWRGEARTEDLILTRVITLDGLEPGHNQGSGRDSRERYIYLHGTNQEHLLGQAVSHGCIRFANADIEALFELLREGDALLVPDSDVPDALGLGRLHFAGVAGSGMSALAQFVAMKGGRASGSDRALGQQTGWPGFARTSRGEHEGDAERPKGAGGPPRSWQGEARRWLEALGIALRPQDGSAMEGDCAGLVVSTAVEDTVPDVAAAKRLGIPILHRSELLAHFVATHRTLAITGTSGKSTTTAMAFELLRGVGRDPSLITGGDVRSLQAEGLWGNAWAGSSDLLVIEADESDGSVVRYHPAVGVVLNLQKDHKEEAEVFGMFEAFRRNTRETFVVGEAENLRNLREAAVVFGSGPTSSLRAEEVQADSEGSRFIAEGVPFELTIPGRHNVENALAALAACRALGVPLRDLAAPLRDFQGVGRRFQVLGQRNGITVVDDFGHNPAKIAASLRTAHLRARRVLAVFQPHGFGPLRFLRNDLTEMFAAELHPEDRLWLLEAHYAGGTANRDVSSADLAADLQSRRCPAVFAPDRPGLVAALAAEARPGDLILVMGARDPSLTLLAREVMERLDWPGWEG